MKPGRLHGKVAIVTGASQGIGAAIAARFAESGARVIGVDLKPGTGIHAADVTRKADVERVVQKVLDEHRQIDILINNAGIISDNLLKNITEADWDRVLEVNAKGVFLCCQTVAEPMRARKYGKIVNLASRSWLGAFGQANYSASKGAVVSLTRTLALELARDQINVNAVAPGLIDTPMTRGMPEKARERLLRMQPTGKMGRTEDIAAAVEFLASDDASFITGQVLHVDGGKSCGILSL